MGDNSSCLATRKPRKDNRWFMCVKWNCRTRSSTAMAIVPLTASEKSPPTVVAVFVIVMHTLTSAENGKRRHFVSICSPNPDGRGLITENRSLHIWYWSGRQWHKRIRRHFNFCLKKQLRVYFVPKSVHRHCRPVSLASFAGFSSSKPGLTNEFQDGCRFSAAVKVGSHNPTKYWCIVTWNRTVPSRDQIKQFSVYFISIKSS